MAGVDASEKNADQMDNTIFAGSASEVILNVNKKIRVRAFSVNKIIEGCNGVKSLQPLAYNINNFKFIL